MRPDGFKSKNRIEVDMRPRNIESCKFCDAVAQKRKNAIDLVRAIMNNNAKMAP